MLDLSVCHTCSLKKTDCSLCPHGVYSTLAPSAKRVSEPKAPPLWVTATCTRCKRTFEINMAGKGTPLEPVIGLCPDCQ